MDTVIDFFTQLKRISILDNSLLSLFIFLAAILFGLVFRKMISGSLCFLLFHALNKSSKVLNLRILKVHLQKPVQFFLLLFIVFGSASILHFPNNWNLVPESIFGVRFILSKIFYQLIIIASTWLGLVSTDLWAFVAVKDTNITSKAFDKQLLPFVKQSLKILIVIFSFFFSLGFIFGLNVSSIIAGLGIGGIAVALAGKETLENLISSFVIFLDHPFEVGDIVSVEGRTGTVEEIGFRSTRVRNFDKTLTVIPNKLMVDKSLDNLTSRTTSRIMYKLNFPLHTQLITIQELVNSYKLYLDSLETLDGSSIVSFSDIDSGSYGITLIFFVKTNDLLEIILTKHQTNLGIVSITEAKGLNFTPPLQLVEINNYSKN